MIRTPEDSEMPGEAPKSDAKAREGTERTRTQVRVISPLSVAPARSVSYRPGWYRASDLGVRSGASYRRPAHSHGWRMDGEYGCLRVSSVTKGEGI